MKNAQGMYMLKRAYQITWFGKKDQAKLVDTARNGMVVFEGTYRQVMAEAKRRGLTYS